VNRWIVMTSSARSGTRQWGQYRNVAVVKLTIDFAEKGMRPAMISERAEGVMKVRDLGLHRLGKTPRSAYAKALAYAENLAERLNQEEK
jgi:hypothetical protein